MKKLLVICFISSLFICEKINAQQWCSPGATWKYESAFTINYLFKFQYVGDTLLNGTNANIINMYSRIYFYGAPGSEPYAGQEELRGSAYTLYRNDTLYHWLNNQFKFLYDFGASVGDLWEVEIPSPIDSTAMCPSELKIVDSVGIGNINGITMRWVAYTSNTVYGSGKAYERFGPINNYLFPLIFSCDFPEPTLLILRCYSDNEIGEVTSNSTLYLQPQYPCDLYENVSIKTISNSDIVRIFPNPANNFITIQNNKSTSLHCVISNSIGQEVSHHLLIDLNNNIELHLNSGIYYLKVFNVNNELESIQKLIITGD